jgi:hypothetical protein
MQQQRGLKKESTIDHVEKPSANWEPINNPPVGNAAQFRLKIR